MPVLNLDGKKGQSANHAQQSQRPKMTHASNMPDDHNHGADPSYKVAIYTAHGGTSGDLSLPPIPGGNQLAQANALSNLDSNTNRPASSTNNPYGNASGYTKADNYQQALHTAAVGLHTLDTMMHNGMHLLYEAAQQQAAAQPTQTTNALHGGAPGSRVGQGSTAAINIKAYHQFMIGLKGGAYGALEAGLMGMSLMSSLGGQAAPQMTKQPVFPKFPWMTKAWEAKTQGSAWDHFMDRHPTVSNIWDRTAYTAEQAEDFVLNSPIGGVEHVAEMAVVAGGAKLAAISKGLFGGKMFAAGVFGKGGKEGLEDLSKISFPDNESMIGHIFRMKTGHLLDTPENRSLIESVANKSENYFGKDKFGNDWHASVREDGSQVWISSRSGVIRDAGLNDIPRTYNSETGFSSPIRPIQFKNR